MLLNAKWINDDDDEDKVNMIAPNLRNAFLQESPILATCNPQPSSHTIKAQTHYKSISHQQQQQVQISVSVQLLLANVNSTFLFYIIFRSVSICTSRYAVI